MAYSYNQILFGHEKEWCIDKCYNMDKPWKYYAKRKKPITKSICFMIVYKMLRMDKFIETESSLISRCLELGVGSRVYT